MGRTAASRKRRQHSLTRNKHAACLALCGAEQKRRTTTATGKRPTLGIKHAVYLVLSGAEQKGAWNKHAVMFLVSSGAEQKGATRNKHAAMKLVLSGAEQRVLGTNMPCTSFSTTSSSQQRRNGCSWPVGVGRTDSAILDCTAARSNNRPCAAVQQAIAAALCNQVQTAQIAQRCCIVGRSVDLERGVDGDSRAAGLAVDAVAALRVDPP